MGKTMVWTDEAMAAALHALPSETFTLIDMRTVAAGRTGLKAQPASGEGLKSALLRAHRIEVATPFDKGTPTTYRRVASAAASAPSAP